MIAHPASRRSQSANRDSDVEQPLTFRAVLRTEPRLLGSDLAGMQRQLERYLEARDRIASSRLKLLAWRTESQLLQVERILENLERCFADEWSQLELAER